MLLRLSQSITLWVDSQMAITSRRIGQSVNQLTRVLGKTHRVRSIVDEVIKIPLVRDTLLLVLNLLHEEYANAA